MTILVPLDGSATAEAAVPVALQLARGENARLILLMVITPHPAPDPAPVEGDLVPIRSAEAYLASAKQRLAGDYRNVLTAVWRGAAAAAIVRAAHDYGAGWIVMTTHGRTGAQRDMFGSVADAVLRGASMPVVVLRPAREAAPTPAGKAEPVVTHGD
ncbi:MAG TPA: universal stress protein [Methylomirabilota bacterium]|nr:universal stress protein [Methylomirabilota bacterium]